MRYRPASLHSDRMLPCGLPGPCRGAESGQSASAAPAHLLLESRALPLRGQRRADHRLRLSGGRCPRARRSVLSEQRLPVPARGRSVACNRIAKRRHSAFRRRVRKANRGGRRTGLARTTPAPARYRQAATSGPSPASLACCVTIRPAAALRIRAARPPTGLARMIRARLAWLASSPAAAAGATPCAGVCEPGQVHNCRCECEPTGCAEGEYYSNEGCKPCEPCPQGQRLVNSQDPDVSDACLCEPEDVAAPCARCEERVDPGDPTSLCVPVACPPNQSAAACGGGGASCCCDETIPCAGAPPVPVGGTCDCPPGYNRASPGAECEREPCPPNQVFQPGTGACQCPPCGRNYRQNPTTCGCTFITCPPNQAYRPGESVCRPIDASCPPGTRRNGEICEPVSCPPGTEPAGGGSTACVPVPCGPNQERNEAGRCVPTQAPCRTGTTRNSQGFCCPNSCPPNQSARVLGSVCACRNDPCPPGQARPSTGGACVPTGCGSGQIRCTTGAPCTPTPAPCPSGQSRSTTCGPCTNDPCPSGCSRGNRGGPCTDNPCPPNQTRGGDCGPCTAGPAPPDCPPNEERTSSFAACTCSPGYNRNNQGVCEETGTRCPPCEEFGATNICQPKYFPNCTECDPATGEGRPVQCPQGTACSRSRGECVPLDLPDCPPCQRNSGFETGFIGDLQTTCQPLRCDPPKVCVPNADECRCPATICPPCQRFNPDTCACDQLQCSGQCETCNPVTDRCETTQCPPCQRLDSMCNCVPLACANNCLECDQSTDRCEPKVCPEGQTCRDGSCTCTNTCGPCHTRNRDCSCHNTCGSNQYCGTVNGDERCIPDSCPPGEELNPSTGNCDPVSEVPSCPPDQEWDVNTLQCVPTGGGAVPIPCPPCVEPQRCNTATGRCE